MRPPTTNYALGHETPTSVGRLDLRIHTRSTTGAPLHLDLPDVHDLRHDAVPLLIGLHFHQRLRLVVDTARILILLGPTATPIRCAVERGHLTLPPSPARPPRRVAAHYTRTELSHAPRQFGHASVDALLRAFPRGTCPPANFIVLKDVAATCAACQQHAHLPRRPRCGNKEGANKYPVATLTIQERRTQRVDLPRGPRRRKGAQGLGLERDAKI